MFNKHLLSLLFTFLILVGCKDEVPTIQTLTAIQVENEISLTWTPTKVSGFQYYKIMRASDGQHYTTINDVVNENSEAFDVNTCSFSDASFPYVDSLFYKIMVFGDEIISSQNVCVHVQKPIILSQNIQNAFIMPDEKMILVFGSDGYNASMNLFDYTTNKLIRKKTITLTSSNSSVFFGKYNGKYEFYCFDGWNNKLNIYDGVTFAELASMSYWSGYPFFSTNNNGTIYSNSGSYYINIISRKNLSYTNYQGSNYIDKLYYMNESNKLIGTYYNKMVLYTLDETGSVVSENSSSISYSSSPIYINNSNLVYWGESGSRKIINTENWQVNTLIFPNGENKDFSTFYAKNNIIYACSNYEMKLYCFSMADNKLIKIINLRIAPTKFLSDSEYLFFYGNLNGLYIVDKIRLIQ